MSTESRAKAIYDAFLMRIVRRDDHSYWLLDLKDNNNTPKVVVKKHSDNLSKWMAIVINPSGEKITFSVGITISEKIVLRWRSII